MLRSLVSWRQPAPRPGLGRALRSARALVACLLLTTCSTDSALAPGHVVESRLDVGFLFRAGGAVPIPVDTVLVELRRASDSSIAYSARLPSSQFAQQSDSLILTIQLELRSSPEQFYFYAAAIGGGVTYYTVSGQVTAVANQSVSTPPLAPTYVGPGSTADSVRLTLSAAQVLAGDSVLASATVYDNNAAVPGVPVGIGTSDSSLVLPRSQGVDDAWLVAQPGATGGVTVTAVTPTGLTFSLNLALGSPTTGPATVTALSPTAVSGIVNQLVGQAPSVEVRDSTNAPAAGVTVTFAVAAGNGTVTGGTQVTNGSGIATVGGWRLAQAVGSDTLLATVAGLPPVRFTATSGPTAIATLAKDSGDVQSDTAGRTLAQPLVVQARDTFANLIPGLTVNWTATDGAVAPTSGSTDAQGRARTSWTLGFLQASPTVTASAGGVQTIFTATTFFTAPTIQLSFTSIPGVGIGLTSVVRVQLNQPAPTGGTLVTLTSGNTAFFTVAPGTVTIPQGQTTDSVTITGLSAGTALLTASATGYTSGTLSVDVQNRNISVPVTLNVPYGQTASLPIQLPAPAPAGGVTFTVVSSDPTHVAVTTSTVTIAAGQQAANATLSGVLPGPATVTVSNAAYIDGVTSANTTAALDITSSSVTLDASFGTSILIEFESSGVPTAAPAPGISVILTAGNSACVSVQSPQSIPTGFVNVSSALGYGGSATLPCTTYVTASAANLISDSVSVTVNPQPGITLAGATVGSGLQEQPYYWSNYLGATNHGGVWVTLTSSNPAVLLVSRDAVTPGSAVDSVFVPNGQQYFGGYYVQGVEGQVGRATVTATAPGFSTGSVSDSVAAPGVQLNGVPSTTTTLSASNNVYAYIGVPYSGNSGVTAQNIRAGGTPVTVTFTASNPAVTDLLKAGGGGGAATQTALIPVGQYYTPFDTTSGGVALRPQGAGTDTVSASVPGFIQTTSAVASPVTVSQPTITLAGATVGSGLQEQPYYWSNYLGATNHGGVWVTLTSSNPAVLLVSRDAVTPGSAVDSVFVPNGQQYFGGYYVQGVEGQVGRATVTATAPGFSTGSVSDSVATPGVQLVGVPSTTTTLSPSSILYAYIGVPYSGNGGLQAYQSIRAGGTSVTVTFTSQVPAVADLLKAGPSFAASQSVTVGVGQSSTPYDTTAGGVRLRPVLAGQTTITASVPGFVQTTSAAGSVMSVAQPGITLAGATVGSGMQEQPYYWGNYLGAPDHGGVTVTLRSSNPLVLIAPNASTQGADTLQLFVPDGQQYFGGFYVQALEGGTGRITLTASAPGFTDGTATVDVLPAGFVVYGLPTTAVAAGGADVSFYAAVGYLYNGNTSLAQQNIRAGATPVTVTFSSSNAAVGPLVSGGVPLAVQTTTIPAQSSNTAGAVSFRPLAPGTATITTTIPGYTPVAGGSDQRTVAVQ